jgi:acyl transferase domain-containing protein/acyl carrier protein
MGADVAAEFDAARQAWDRSVGLADEHGTTVASVNFPRPVFSEEQRALQELVLTETEWAQPALGIVSLGYLNLLAQLDIEAACMAGHSFGELTALHAAGVIDEASFLRSAWKRGRLLKAAAVHPGAMTAVTASMPELEKWIRKSGSGAVIANANEPGQTVASGTVDNIDALEKLLGREKIPFKRLRVATGFHSPVVAEASGEFRDFLSEIEFRPATIPVYSNTQVLPYRVDRPDLCRDLLASQISMPVRFVEQISAMYESGVRVFLEVGPGSTLTNLTQRCLAGLPHHAIPLDRRGVHGVAALYTALARLSVAGVRLNYDGLFSEFREPALPKKAKPGVTFPISGVNYGKPYPGRGTGTLQSNQKPERKPEQRKPQQKTVQPVAPVTAKSSTNSLQTVIMTTNNNGTTHSKENHGWLPAYLEIQRQTAEAHLFYQRAMTEGHTAYLRTMETFFNSLSGMPALALPADRSLSHLPAPSPSLVFSPAPPPARAQAMPQPEAAPAMQPPVMPAAKVAVPAPSIAVPARAIAVVAPAAKSFSIPIEELKAMLLTVVAEKTGYPVEMLEMEMDMEADLGIDSIKRVEILSAFLSLTPDMPEIKGKEMAGLRTLAQITKFVEASVEATTAPRGLL